MRRVSMILLIAAVLFGIWAMRETSAGGGGEVPGAQCVAGDVNCDDLVDISDPVYLLNHLFLGGPGPREACAEACAACPFSDSDVARLRELLDEREFGTRVAGLWYAPIPGDLPFAVVSVGADGTFVSNDQNDMFPFFNSTMGGHWRRIGENEVLFSGFIMVWATDDQNDGLDGVFKVSFNATLSEDSNSMVGELCQLKWCPGSEPNLDEPCAPEFVEPTPFQVTRLTPVTCFD